MIFDTIAAVSTPRGKGGISVIRISGEDARTVLGRVFRPKGKTPLAYPRCACYGEIVRGNGTFLDTGIAVYFNAPHSFTGEDVVEISCHGGVLLTEQVLAAVFSAGARQAQAGEFTRRAVMNGKMKLSSAEALGSLLEARTDGQLELARGGMGGVLSQKIEVYFVEITTLLADAYAKIDFPDEDLNNMSREELGSAFAKIRDELLALADSYRTGHAVAEGVRTVLCGPVNAGKSTLYNALVGREAAIVTDLAGTTRDVLCETVALGRVTLRLSDTAGLREAADAVEQIGVSRAREEMANAELILCVLNAADPSPESLALLRELKKSVATVVVVLNQCDKGDAFPTEALSDFAHVVRISAAKGEIEPLSRTVEALYMADGINLRADPIVASARQHAALCRAAASLSQTVEALLCDVPLDAALVDAELALSALGELDGRAVDEAIVSEIFSHFCVGK